MAGYVLDLGGAQEGFHTGGDGADLVEYLFRGGRPCDRSTVTVPMRNERLDRLVESLHGAERATPDQLPSDDTVPDLDLIHPRRTGGSEVENDSPPAA